MSKKEKDKKVLKKLQEILQCHDEKRLEELYQEMKDIIDGTE